MTPLFRTLDHHAAVGGTSVDELFGGPGPDEVDSNGESDRIYGGGSSDSLSGGDGHDIMFGDGWNKRDAADNVLDGGAGNDLLQGSGGSDLLNGGPDADQLYGGIPWSTDGTAQFGRDTLNGDAGDDEVLLIGASFTTESHATVDGGEGQDLVRVYEIEVPPEQQAPATIDLAVANASIEGGAEHVALPGFESARGTPADDVLIGTDGPNALDGYLGDDTIVAAGGDDTITATDGHDRVDAGAGDDEVHMPYQSGLVDIDAGAGTDLVDIGPGHPVVVDLAAGTWERDGVQAPFVDVENVMGTALSDVLRGSDGPNLLEADGGDDVVVGRGGDDQLTGRVDPTRSARYGFDTEILPPKVANSYLARRGHPKGVPGRPGPGQTRERRCIAVALATQMHHLRLATSGRAVQFR